MGFLGWQRAPRVGGATVGYGEGTGFSWSANRERHGLRVVFVLRARSPALIEMFASKRTVSLANHPNTGNGESNASGGPSVKRSKKMDAGLSVAELREKHKLERKRRAAESAHSAPQPAMSAFVRDAPFTESAQRAPQAKPSDILSSNPSIKTSGILQVSQPQPLRQSNPFGQKPDARSHQTRNPFNILASIESTSYVCSSNPSSIFPTSTRLMTRYNSCPNVLQSSLQKPQSFSDHDSVEGDDDDDEDIFRESRQISDFIDQDEDLIAFHSACARLENGSLPDNCKTLAPLSRATSNTLSCEPYAGTATATSRLFSLLVNTKSDSRKHPRTVFQLPIKKSVQSGADNEAKEFAEQLAPEVGRVSNSEIAEGQVSEPTSSQLDYAVDTEINAQDDFPTQTGTVVSGQSFDDVSIKTELSIISTQLVPWLEERTETDKYITLLNHTTKAATSTMNLKAKFDNCLVSYLYPNAPKAPTHVGLMTRVLAIKPETPLKPFERNELAHFKAQEQEWKQSFKSLFASLLVKHAESFYYMNSEFTALFQGPTSRSNPTQDFRCVLAKASPGLRKVLLKRGITFMSVLSPQKIKTSYTGLEDAGDEEKKEARVELREMERIQPGRTVASASVHMIPMQLLMNGLDSVTKLYEYLLDWVEHSVEKRALHLPMLVSPSPFLHASLKMAEILKTDRIERMDAEDSIAEKMNNRKGCSSKPRCAFTMKLAGILLPSSVATMKEIVEFSCMGSESVKIMMTSEERTIGLNLELGSTVRQGEAEADVENPVKAHIDAKTCGKVVNLLQFDEGKWLQ